MDAVLLRQNTTSEFSVYTPFSGYKRALKQQLNMIFMCLDFVLER